MKYLAGPYNVYELYELEIYPEMNEEEGYYLLYTNDRVKKNLMYIHKSVLPLILEKINESIFIIEKTEMKSLINSLFLENEKFNL